MVKKTTKVKPKKAIIVKPETASVDTFISQAIESKLPIEVMERLFSLKEKVKAEQAREAFTEALASFQSQCPIIIKTKKVMNKNSKIVRYVYAPIDAIVEQIKKPLSENGFSYTWTVKNEDKQITAIAKITHRFGHSETSSFAVPIDMEGYMTAPQKVASALTFAKRYALCNVLGISTGDEDTDAVDVKKEPEAKDVRAKIIFLLKNLGIESQDKTVIHKEIKRLTQMEATDKNFEEIKNRLEILIEEKE